MRAGEELGLRCTSRASARVGRSLGDLAGLGYPAVMPVGPPLRVACVAASPVTLRFQLLGELGALRAAGHEVTAISAPGPDVEALLRSGFRHERAALTRRLTPAMDLRAIGELTRQFRELRLDLVHLHTPKAILIGGLAARLAGVPRIVATIHGLQLDERASRLRRLAWLPVEHGSARLAHAVLLECESDLRSLAALPAPLRAPAHWIGGGIDLARFRRGAEAERDRREARAELGLPEESLVVGFAGRLAREKGVLDLLVALQRLRCAGGPIHGLFVGPPDRDGRHPVEPEELDPERRQRCVFAGARDDMPRMYAAMDIFALPSRREGRSRVTMEAAAMGLPSVLSDIRGLRELATHDRSALFVPPGDVPALADALRRLAEAPELRVRLGAAAKERAQAEFDEREVWRRILTVYDALGVPTPR